MTGALEPWNDRGSILIAVAAPKEADAILRGLGAPHVRPEPWRAAPIGRRFELLLTGVGKANACAAVARALETGQTSIVVNIGIGGALPDAGLDLLDVVAATSSVFADEGMAAPEGFQDIASMGFAPFPGGGMAWPADSEALQAAEHIVDTSGLIATVSTCSATDALASDIRSRTGAVAEAMEGAAAALAVAQVNRLTGATVPFLELRVISNTTGDRDAQRWDLRGSLERLAELASEL